MRCIPGAGMCGTRGTAGTRNASLRSQRRNAEWGLVVAAAAMLVFARQYKPDRRLALPLSRFVKDVAELLARYERTLKAAPPN